MLWLFIFFIIKNFILFNSTINVRLCTRLKSVCHKNKDALKPKSDNFRSSYPRGQRGYPSQNFTSTLPSSNMMSSMESDQNYRRPPPYQVFDVNFIYKYFFEKCSIVMYYVKLHQLTCFEKF